MLPIITTSDFTGYINLSQNSFKTGDLDLYINTFYPQIVDDFLGVAATTEIQNLADPLPQKWIDLFNGIGTYFNICQEKVLRQPVMLDVVKKVLYFYWLRDDSVNTTSGESFNSVENATMLNRSQLASNAKQRYNAAVTYFNSQVKDFIENYIDYTVNIDSITDLGGMLLQINMTDAIYLADGDTVEIDKNEYVISNLDPNVSFRITASFSSVPTKFIYNPFEVVELCDNKLILF
jgi:hypothetical protein